MTKTSIWQDIQAELALEIAQGLYRAGEKLPSEAALAARFGVNRHTIRQALANLAEEGMVRARRGAGVFVAERAADYPLSLRPRFHETVSALGRLPSRQITRVETRRAAPHEAQALGVAPQAMVHVVEGVSLIDAVPVAAFCSVFDAVRLPNLAKHLEKTASITAALQAEGISDFTRAQTRIGAELASAARAGVLRVAPQAPLLRSEAINVDAAGRVVEYGVAWFVGERVSLTVMGAG